MARRPRGTGWASQAWAVIDSLTIRTGGYSVSGLTATLTTASAHTLAADMYLYLAFAGVSAPPGGFYKVVTAPTPTTITIAIISGSGTGTFSSQLLVKDSFNVSSVQRTGTGAISFQFEKAFATANFGIGGSFFRASTAGFYSYDALPTNSTATVKMIAYTGAAVDSDHAGIHFFGRQ